MLKNLELTKEMLDYIYNHSNSLNSVQKEIIKYNKSLGKLKRMQISETQALLIQLIIKIMNIKKCLEIGTFSGFSSLSIALALPDDGHIITLDNDSKITDIAKKFFKKSSVSEKITSITKPALDALKDFKRDKKKFDLIFIDADKGNYINYFNFSLDLVIRGGIIIIDNVLWHGDVYDKSKNDKKTKLIRDFNSYIKKDKRIEKFIIPIGDGLTVCRKL